MLLNAFAKGAKVLVLGPHPDDEIGCGSSIVKFISLGAHVYHWFFSLCEESLAKFNVSGADILEECNKSRKILGIKPENTGNMNMPVRNFLNRRQEILEQLIKLREQISPDIVFVPNSFDIHQDHHCIYEESVRAFKHCSIFGYELPWNTLTMQHDCFVSITEEELSIKLQALKCYNSQQNKIYANEQFFKSLANIRGVQSGTKYAECYEVIRLIL